MESRPSGNTVDDVMLGKPDVISLTDGIGHVLPNSVGRLTVKQVYGYMY